jgi:DNA-binding transcriptional regulator YdaS (Cro superfamily)
MTYANALNPVSAKERDALADELGLDRRYLYQVLSGRREMSPAEAVAAEQRSAGRLRRWMLRSKSWHLIWPELIGADGVPEVSTATKEAA